MRDLKQRIGFKGWVMSDWGATHSTAIMQGLDQEMPGPGTGMAADLARMVADGDIPESFVDDSVARILTPMYEMGLFDNCEFVAHERGSRPLPCPPYATVTDPSLPPAPTSFTPSPPQPPRALLRLRRPPSPSTTQMSSGPTPPASTTT
jgi:hypothetical protein